MFAIRFDRRRTPRCCRCPRCPRRRSRAREARRSRRRRSRCSCRHFERESEHRALTRRDVGFPIVDADLVGDERILRIDAQDRAVRNEAVEAVVGSGDRDDDHLALGFGKAALAQHQRVVVGEECAELRRDDAPTPGRRSE